MIDVNLRRGTSVDHALQSLKRLKVDVDNIKGPGFGRLLTEYLTWVEDAERELRNLFADRSLWMDLFTDRYWHLRDFATDRPIRPEPLVANEARWQSERLEELISQLESARRVFDLPAGYVAIVPDTNVFAHYRRYNEVDWAGLASSSKARLVVPLLVIDELDELSYKSRSGGARAGKVLRSLQRLRGQSAPEDPLSIRSNVSLQLLMDPAFHRRKDNSDDELLARVEFLDSVTDGTVFVATGDSGMRLRARGRGLAVLELPDALRLVK